MTAIRQLAISVKVGVGGSASAIIGDRIVIALAVTLHTQKTVPRN